jgi:hypothetical protein
MPGIAWTAELYSEDHETPYPVATAYLSDFSGSVLNCVMLDFILVPDQHRCRGYGKHLVKRCIERWPDLELTEAISDEGEALIDSLVGCGLFGETDLKGA